MVSWLESQAGDTWQERWAASGAEAAPDWRDLVACWRTGRAGSSQRPAHICPGLLVLICADVIRPGLAWLSGFAPARRGLAEEMARTRDSAAFAELAGMCQRNAVGGQTGQTALIRVALIMAAKGGIVADITVGDCLELLEVADQVAARLHGGVHSPLFYQLLLDRGGFPGDAPAAMRVFSGRGQPTCEQLIDRYGIACQPVRDVLVDYLAERKLSSDFSSLQRLAYLLGKLFWADLEAHHPGISTLQLPRNIAAAWKQRVMTKAKTTRSSGGESVTAVSARLDGRNVLTAVRSMYLDIAEWADDAPGGCRGRCAARSLPARYPTRRTGRGASRGWTSGPGSGCQYCPPWLPGSAPNATPPRTGCRPPSAPMRARCSPPAGRRCACR